MIDRPIGPFTELAGNRPAAIARRASSVNQRVRTRKNGTAPTTSPSKALIDVVTINGPGVPFASRP